MALTTNVPHPILQMTSYVQNGMSTDINGTLFPLQSGVPLQNLYLFDIIPAYLSSNCISNSNTWQPGGQPLNQTNTGSDNNIISTALNLKNITGFGISNRDVTGILLDCERGISLSFSGGTLIANTTVTVTGFDYLGNALQFSQALSGTVGTVYINQPISIVTSVVFSANFNPGGSGAVTNVAIGNSNIIGLPYYLPNLNSLIQVGWTGSEFLSTVTPGNNWRITNPSSTPVPVRGSVNLPSNADGENLLTVLYYVYGSDSELNAELNNANQSSLKIASIQTSTGSNPQTVIPYLTQYDLTGVVYPADNDFIYAYGQAKLS